MKPTNNLVLFHGNCPDGVTSAWAAWKRFGDDAEYVPVFHPNKMIPDCTGKNVYMLDFACPRSELLAINKVANSFLVLDHHVGNAPELSGLPFAIFDLDRAGAGMSWDYFHPTLPRPAMVDLIEDRDIRKFSYAESDPILHLFDDSSFHQSFDPETTFDLMSEFSEMIELDKQTFGGYDRSTIRTEFTLTGMMVPGMERHNKFLALCNNISIHATPLEICGIKGLAVNCPVPFEDAIGTMLANRCNGVGVVYHHTPENPHRVKLSLRSTGGLDVMSIAQKLGGNGHFNASGCQIPFADLFKMFSVPVVAA